MMDDIADTFSLNFIKAYRSTNQPCIEQFIKIGHYVIKFVFYSNSMAEIMMRPFQHLIVTTYDSISFTIHSTDSNSTISVPHMNTIINNDIDIKQNQNLYFNNNGIHMLHNTLTSITSLVDMHSNEAFYYIDSIACLPDYEKAAPYRMIFHWFGILNNMSLIHGAVIAQNGIGWLLAGRGGAGKSTLSLLSFIDGLSLIGDDYVLVENKGNPTAYSLYNSIKVNPDIIEKYPFLDHYIANRSSLDYDKGHLFVDEIPGNGMSLSADLAGIIMLTGALSEIPCFNKISGLKALSIIGSSTVFQMPGINRDFLGGIVKLINNLENHEFSICDSINKNLRALKDFIITTPLISVIMPVYNGSEHIKRSINSVLTQSYENFELIIINDASTDNTADIIKSFNDNRIKYLHQENAGPGAARNNGISHSFGRYIALLDHDDKWYPNKLEKQLIYMREHPGLPVLYCRHNLIFKGNIDDYPWIQQIEGEIRYSYEIPSSMFVDKRIFDRVGVFNPIYRTAEDSDLYLRLKDSGIGIKVMDDILFDKHIHGGNISQNIESNRKFVTLLLASSIKRKQFAKKVKISVIIPAYNPDKHLLSCIRSILGQTLSPYEIVITDDGSTNNITDLVSEINDSRIKIFRQENKGISSARNFAVKNSTGNILAFVDSDDLWTEDKLKLQCERLLSDSAVQAVFGCIRQFYSPEVDEAYREKYYFDDKVTKGILPGTLFITKDDFNKVGPFNENLRVGELFDWIHRFNKLRFNYVVLPDILMYRRLHYNNNGILNKQDRIDFTKTFAQIIKDKKNERT